jgi:ribosomal protein S18 acetylase RimI-like enzyme
MNTYTFRRATEKDIPFLAKVVIEAEKGGTSKLGLSTLFNLTEKQVQELLIAIFDEGIEGCEFSYSSFLIAEHDNKPIAALGGWIEAFNGSKSSKILKSNLITFTLASENFDFFKERAYLVKELSIDREPMAFQIEYVFIEKQHQGNQLFDQLFKKLENHALKIFPALKKVQGHVFKSNKKSIRTLEKSGFHIVQSYKSSQPETLNYLPSNEKYLVEKIIK